MYVNVGLVKGKTARILIEVYTYMALNMDGHRYRHRRRYRHRHRHGHRQTCTIDLYSCRRTRRGLFEPCANSSSYKSKFLLDPFFVVAKCNVFVELMSQILTE